MPPNDHERFLVGCDSPFVAVLEDGLGGLEEEEEEDGDPSL
jgi:hypothetical protein